MEIRLHSCLRGLLHDATSSSSTLEHLVLSLLLVADSLDTGAVLCRPLLSALEGLHLSEVLSRSLVRHSAGLGQQLLEDLRRVLVLHIDGDYALVGRGGGSLGKALARRHGLDEGCVGRGGRRVAQVYRHKRRHGGLGVAVDNHGRCRVVEFETGQAFAPELPTKIVRISVLA